ncbi:hypothetical protein GTA51_17230 [Desulfovibrio aerotolerans]|uniref:Uncharacterized protein n=1 Tax=Solidesulfovibrio aerotolerans TaxID=295255 RepID=A0A7C9JB68_9BACT|nr:hypothetical protein [Solidesulfovibrio aerotolerans]MYL84858.1 hypothetical protein [Solidesulfovibrio aerotolerans]
MSDSSGAASIVRNKFDTAQNYANDAWHSATSFLARMGGVARMVYPNVALPDLPARPEYPGVTAPPDLGSVTLESVAAPAVPQLAGLVLDGIDIPRFTLTPPDIVLPEAPEMVLPEAPGKAPNLPEVELPPDPAIVLPAPPVFAELVIPELPGIITPRFEGERPPMPELLAPGNLFVAPPAATYDSPLRAALAERLEAEVRNGGAGFGPELEEGLWQRSRQRLEDELATKLANIADDFAARGASGLSGPMAVMLRAAAKDAAEAMAGHNLELLARQTELASVSGRAAVDQALALEAQGIELFNQSAARAFEGARELARFGYEALHAEVAVHNAQIARYQADAAVFEARIRATLAELEAFKARIEGAKLAGEAQKRAADLYLAELSGVTALVGLYKARMEGAAAKSALGRDRLAAYEAQVAGYVAAVNANTARFNAHAAALAGQEVKARLYAEQVRAFGAEVDAAKVAAETRLAVSARDNEVRLDAYKADVTRFEAELRQGQARAEILLKDKELALGVYDSGLKAGQAEAELRSRDHAAQVDAFLKSAEVSIKQADMLLQNSLGELRLEAEKIRSGAQVSAQMAASALNAVNATAQIGYSESVGERTSTSTTESTQRSVSESTSKSNGSRESFNHNYNYRV